MDLLQITRFTKKVWFSTDESFQKSIESKELKDLPKSLAAVMILTC